MADIDSEGVYYLSVEEFESRKPVRKPGQADPHPADAHEPDDQPEVDATKSAITRPSSSPQSS